jgi:hypothetical protein
LRAEQFVLHLAIQAIAAALPKETHDALMHAWQMLEANHQRVWIAGGAAPESLQSMSAAKQRMEKMLHHAPAAVAQIRQGRSPD